MYNKYKRNLDFLVGIIFIVVGLILFYEFIDYVVYSVLIFITYGLNLDLALFIAIKLLCGVSLTAIGTLCLVKPVKIYGVYINGSMPARLLDLIALIFAVSFVASSTFIFSSWISFIVGGSLLLVGIVLKLIATRLPFSHHGHSEADLFSPTFTDKED